MVAEPQGARHAHRCVGQVRAVYVIDDVQNEQERQQPEADNAASVFANWCRVGRHHRGGSYCLSASWGSPEEAGKYISESGFRCHATALLPGRDTAFKYSNGRRTGKSKLLR